ncbi:hypothetical protein O9G_006275, partial [Rozella allomycis CSF55]
MVKDLINHVGLSGGSKVTHIRRVGAACKAEDLGVSGDQVDRQGLWAAHNERLKCYQTSNVPKNLILALAGFPPHLGSYDIKRSNIIPSTLFQRQIFPFIGDLSKNIEIGLLPQKQTNINFINDAVFLKHICPSHIVFEHPVFRHDDFTAYEAQVLSIPNVDQTKNQQSDFETNLRNKYNALDKKLTETCN